MDTKIDVAQARSKALEVGVFLPLGAFSKVKERIADLDQDTVRSTYRDLVRRGERRSDALERRIRRRVRRADSKAQDVADDIGQAARKAGARGREAGAAVAPTMPRVAAPKKASDLPIKSYHSLTADEILARTRGLNQTDLAKVYKFEKANEERVTVLEGLESRFIELPIPTYDALTVEEISERLERLKSDQLKTLLRYEKETKARSSVIDKLEAKL